MLASASSVRVPDPVPDEHLPGSQTFTVDVHVHCPASFTRRTNDATVAPRPSCQKFRPVSMPATVAPEVDYDPARALSFTAATKPLSKSERLAEREMAAQVGGYRVKSGYTSKQIMSDKRYRTIESLRAAGLHQHPHARAAVAAIPPSRVITQHLTTNQLTSMKS